MFFTEQEQEDLVFSTNVYEEEDGYQGRWTQHKSTVVGHEGKFYRVFWESGLTEYQENVFDEGECDEVFPVRSTRVSPSLEYLTEEEQAERESNTLVSRFLADAPSLKVATGVDASEVARENSEAVAEALALLERLSVLNDSDVVSAHAEAAREYFEAMKKVGE